MTLTEFLLARYAEEYEAAIEMHLVDPLLCPVCTAPVAEYVAPATFRGYRPNRPDRCEPCGHELTEEQAASCHKRVIPQRIDRDLEAKRQIVWFLTSREADPMVDRPWWWEQQVADPVLISLALPYADHPDYREEWQP